MRELQLRTRCLLDIGWYNHINWEFVATLTMITETRSPTGEKVTHVQNNHEHKHCIDCLERMYHHRQKLLSCPFVAQRLRMIYGRRGALCHDDKRIKGYTLGNQYHDIDDLKGVYKSKVPDVPRTDGQIE